MAYFGLLLTSRFKVNGLLPGVIFKRTKPNPSLNTQSCIRRPLCSKVENLSTYLNFSRLNLMQLFSMCATKNTADCIFVRYHVRKIYHWIFIFCTESIKDPPSKVAYYNIIKEKISVLAWLPKRPKNRNPAPPKAP